MQYQELNQLLNDAQAPLAFVDMVALDKNIEQVHKRSGGKNIRIATKSIRVREILTYIKSKLPETCGWMTFTVEEALWLAEKGFSDILMGYPTLSQALVKQVFSKGFGDKITFMVDSSYHVNWLNQLASEFQIQARICLDVDMSSSFTGLYFGVYRSPIKTKEQVAQLLDETKACENVSWVGLMGYEAQIAGVGDEVPGQLLKSKIVKILKGKSIIEVAKRREECLHEFDKRNISLEFVNGGGTGSMESTRMENRVTEITVGSGFFQSHLFDAYSNFKHSPAAFFAVQIVRQPQQDIFTALGGGYIASGATDPSKQPIPFWPKGLELIKNEGTGEVQTPLKYKGKENLKIGDWVILRHAKAGEVMERFNEIRLLRNGKFEGIMLTYRGEGKCFL